ncbi:MAG TPA: Gmad2 immunoglobulin-like domain-containing protein, partial [Acidimicrobiia bacterium]|nr:Gmad2 immunoglobulin-like domain-containing protein [Acidimicrobiia bacterium]
DDNQKMRQLVDRLVAMSPEPPPFPEEMIMAKPATRRRRNPVLMFTGAAALVLLLAVVPLLLLEDTAPSAGTTLPTVTDTRLPDQTTVTEQPPLVTQQAVVYLAQSPENSSRGGNPALVSFLTEVSGAEDESGILLALQLLADSELALPAGFDNVIPAGIEILDVSIDGDIINVEANEDFLAGAGGTLGDFTMLNQLIFTATQSNPAALVQFTVNGEPIQAFGGNGLDLTNPMGREAHLDDNVNSVIVTSIETSPDGVTVTGLAQVFEGTVNWDVIDSDGKIVEIVDDTFTTTEGAPAWGEYSFEVPHDFEQTPGSIRVFWYSPRDGSATDVVTIPIRAAGNEVWNLRP